MAVVVDTKVVAIEEYNKWYGDKYKNVFYCKSKQPTPRMCISWGRTSLRVGDEVRLTGRVKDTGEFICWNILIFKRAENPEAGENETNENLSPRPLRERDRVRGENETNDFQDDS